MQKKLALFDFDGTITSKDSLVDFIQYAVGKKRYYLGLLSLSPMLTMYLFKLIPNHTAKEQMIGYFFSGWSSQDFQETAKRYALTKIDNIVKKSAIEKIQWHQKRGDVVVVVSASIRCWLEPWCKKNNLQLLATELEMQEDKLTGKFKTPNCYGKEKVHRIKHSFDLKTYSFIYAYGDSNGDKAMLSIADEAHYQYFNN